MPATNEAMTPMMAIEHLRQEAGAIWMTMPDEVGALRQRTGTKNYHWPVIICAEENTRAFADAVSVLRELSMDVHIDVESFKRVVAAFVKSNLAVLENWYGLERSVEIIERILPCLPEVKDRAVLATLLQELLVYAGRLHWWVDTLVPWDEMSGMYDATFATAE